MKHSFPLLLALFASQIMAGENKPLVVGDGQIDGRKIQPYELTWHQCSLTEGEWVDSGNLIEQVAIIGKQTLRLRHLAKRPGGTSTVATTYFDRESFAPLRMELVATLSDGTRKPLSVHQLSPEGYHGWTARGETVRAVKGKISSQMLHGMTLGPPLATLAYQDSPLEFAASMISFDGTYRVIAHWAGKEVLEYKGKKIDAWMIDVEWHHNESGDVYAAGPDGSGGRYWVVQNPPEGFPYVPRYKTDSYAVEFIPHTCPN